MRVLIVVPSLGRAGAETQAVDLANGLFAMGHEVHLCSFERQLDQRSRLNSEVIFHHILRRRKYDLSMVAALAETIDRERIEIVLGVLQFATLVAWLASRRSRIKPPVVAAVHTTIHRGLKQELQDRMLYRHVLRHRPAVVFVCNHQQVHWVQKYPELAPLARVVHNGIDPARFARCKFVPASMQLREDLKISGNAFVFTSIAGFRPEKGHDLLIRAFAQASDEAYLILAGDGERRPLVEAQVSEAGLAERVRFLGNVEDVRPVIVASDVTVLASTAVETFSMAMLESMALGVPVIAPRIGGLPEAIVPGETGLLFPIGDSEKLSHCMRSMAEDPFATKKMGQMGQAKVAVRFTLDIMLQKYERLLLDVLREASPTA